MLALGIGANTAVFSVIDAVLLRPLPYPNPDQLIVLRERMAAVGTGSISYPDYLDWRASQRTCTDLAMARRDSFNVSFPAALGAPPERVNGTTITANYLTILGVRPELGRDFHRAGRHPRRAESRADQRVALASPVQTRIPRSSARNSWSTASLTKSSAWCPRRCNFPRQAEMFTTVGDLRQSKNLLERDNHVGFTGVGRLKPGVSLAQADQDLDRIARELTRRYPASNTGRSISIKTLLDYTVGDYRQSLCLLLGAVGCVLLIACANVANLQLARASGTREGTRRPHRPGCQPVAAGAPDDHRERAARIAGRGGGGIALVVGRWMPSWRSARPACRASGRRTWTPPVLAFTVALALVTGIVVGVWPAWRVSGAAAMARALHEGSARGGTGGAGQQRTRALLVVAQVALAVVLLAGAGVMLRSFWRVQSEPLGFQPAGRLTLSVALPDIRYRNEKGHLFFQRVAGAGPRAAGRGRRRHRRQRAVWRQQLDLLAPPHRDAGRRSRLGTRGGYETSFRPATSR